jgi:beta-N-acetylhexosaminidase
MQLLLLILKAMLAAACLAAGTTVRMPTAADYRPWLFVGLMITATVLLVVSLRWRGWSKRNWTDRLDLAPFGLAAAALIATLATEGRFQFDRWSVLRAAPPDLERVGRHIVVGYRDAAFVRDLVERRAIGGVFVTRANVAGRDAASVASEIRDLQAIRHRQGLPPLWVATDQEGGIVSRLSPPLERQPPLARVVREANDMAGRQAAVMDYATRQGRGLSALGVNLNFAPVVDLDFGKSNPDDAFTRISERAISRDADVVSAVAGWYCDGLAAQGVRCTLKHFPGLGRVFEDTHRDEGVLSASLEELARADWIPFRSMLGRADSLVMVGHVRLPALDPVNPVSISRRAITGLLRDRWDYDGIIITDDLCMGAIYSGQDGIGRASVQALNAGVDLLLVSWDGAQVYPVLAALLRGALDAETLRKSADRLRAAQGRLRVETVAR